MLQVGEIAKHAKAPVFPQELLIEIAEHLASSYSLATLASLNITSRQTRTDTLRVLYRSVILVARDPQGIEEWEKPFALAETVPEGWKYTHYLSIGPDNHDRLLKRAAALRDKSSDVEALHMLFPRLVLLCLRTPRLQGAKDSPIPSSPPPPAFGFGITKTTNITAHVYPSIRPSDLLSACVIGTHRRETTCALGTFRAATCLTESGSPAGTLVAGVKESSIDGSSDGTLRDNIYQISFAPRARFLEETVRSRAAGGFLTVDGSTLDNDVSPGSRSEDIAKGLLGLLPTPSTDDDWRNCRKDSRAEGCFRRTPMTLPTIAVKAGHAIYKPLVKEILVHLPVKAALHITQDHCHDLKTFSDETKFIAAAYRERWQETALSVNHANAPFCQLIGDASDYCDNTGYQAIFQVIDCPLNPLSANARPENGFAEQGFVVTEIIERHGVRERSFVFYPAAPNELPSEMVVTTLQ